MNSFKIKFYLGVVVLIFTFVGISHILNKNISVTKKNTTIQFDEMASPRPFNKEIIWFSEWKKAFKEITPVEAKALGKNVWEYLKPKLLSFKYKTTSKYSSSNEENWIVVLTHQATHLDFCFIPGRTNTTKGVTRKSPNEQQKIPPQINPFLLCQTEVNEQTWYKVKKETSRKEIRNNMPIHGISWSDANTWCKSVSLRLPTEIEWEYACFIGHQDISKLNLFKKNLEDYAWIATNSGGQPIQRKWLRLYPKKRPHQVALKLPNAFGFYDMIGNVWEYCEDYFYLDAKILGRVAKGSDCFSNFRSGFNPSLLNDRICLEDDVKIPRCGLRPAKSVF